MTELPWKKAGFTSLGQARMVFIDECYRYEFENYLNKLIEYAVPEEKYDKNKEAPKHETVQ